MFSTFIIGLTCKASRQRSKHYCTALRDEYGLMCKHQQGRLELCSLINRFEPLSQCSLRVCYSEMIQNQDHRSKITQIMLHQRNWGIHYEQGLISSLDTPLSERSWIIALFPNHPWPDDIFSLILKYMPQIKTWPERTQLFKLWSMWTLAHAQNQCLHRQNIL